MGFLAPGLPPRDGRGRRVVSNASFYVSPVRLTILIWTVLPAPYRYTEQVPLCLISVYLPPLETYFTCDLLHFSFWSECSLAQGLPPWDAMPTCVTWRTPPIFRQYHCGDTALQHLSIQPVQRRLYSVTRVLLHMLPITKFHLGQREISLVNSKVELWIGQW